MHLAKDKIINSINVAHEVIYEIEIRAIVKGCPHAGRVSVVVSVRFDYIVVIIKRAQRYWSIDLSKRIIF